MRASTKLTKTGSCKAVRTIILRFFKNIGTVKTGKCRLLQFHIKILLYPVVLAETSILR